MKKKVLITERQLKTIVSSIQENEQYNTVLKTIADDLLMNYEPALATYDNGVDFSNKSIITKKVNGDKLSASALFDYMTTKYSHVSDEFIQQVINDWYYGVIDGKNYEPSKYVKLVN